MFFSNVIVTISSNFTKTIIANIVLISPIISTITQY